MATRRKQRETRLSESDEALVRRVTSAIENYPYFRGSAGRVPSTWWIKNAIERYKNQASDEQQLVAMILDDRAEMIQRVQQNRASHVANQPRHVDGTFAYAGGPRNRAAADRPTIVPWLNILEPQKGPPHRHKVLARKVVERPGRRAVEFTVYSNWPETRWWIGSTYVEEDAEPDLITGRRRTRMWKASDFLSTSRKALADKWIQDVEAGRVEIAERDLPPVPRSKTDSPNRAKTLDLVSTEPADLGKDDAGNRYYVVYVGAPRTMANAYDDVWSTMRNAEVIRGPTNRGSAVSAAVMQTGGTDPRSRYGVEHAEETRRFNRAKLTARGRTELVRLSKISETPDSSLTSSERHTVALMSDGNVMEKRDVVWKDGGKHSYGWTVRGKVKPGLTPNDFAQAYERRGYVAAEAARLGSLGERVVRTEAKAAGERKAREKRRTKAEEKKVQEARRKAIEDGPGFYVTNVYVAPSMMSQVHHGTRVAEMGPYATLDEALPHAWRRYQDFVGQKFDYLLPVQVVEAEDRDAAQHGRGYVWWTDGRRRGAPVPAEQTRFANMAKQRATIPDRHESQRSRHRKWTAYILENGYRDEGAFEHLPGTFDRREAEAEAWRVMRDEDAYYAQKPRAYEGYDEDERSDVHGRL